MPIIMVPYTTDGGLVNHSICDGCLCSICTRGRGCGCGQCGGCTCRYMECVGCGTRLAMDVCGRCGDDEYCAACCGCCGCGDDDEDCCEQDEDGTLYDEYDAAADTSKLRYDSYTLREYSYKPRPLFRGAGTDTMFYGMELEVSADERLYSTASRLLGGERMTYLKSDSTVNGFEAVTHPMSYQWAMNNYPWDGLAGLLKAGCKVRYDSNGLHVHMSRAGFSSGDHQYKWMQFFYRNESDVTRIARRSPGRWGKFTPDHMAGQAAHAAKFGHAEPNRRERSVRYPGRFSNRGGYIWDNDLEQPGPGGAWSRGDWYRTHAIGSNGDYIRNRDGRVRRVRITAAGEEGRRLLAYSSPGLGDTTLDDRYSAINTLNADTLEVRVFASTLTPWKARACLALCDASQAYALHHLGNPPPPGGKPARAWSWEQFIKFAAKTGDYPDLIRADTELR